MGNGKTCGPKTIFKSFMLSRSVVAPNSEWKGVDMDEVPIGDLRRCQIPGQSPFLKVGEDVLAPKCWLGPFSRRDLWSLFSLWYTTRDTHELKEAFIFTHILVHSWLPPTQEGSAEGSGRENLLTSWG